MTPNLSKCCNAEIDFSRATNRVICTACGKPCEVVGKPESGYMCNCGRIFATPSLRIVHSTECPVMIKEREVNPTPPTGRLLSAEEIENLPSGQTVINPDGSMDIRATRLNRELVIAQAQQSLTASENDKEIVELRKRVRILTVNLMHIEDTNDKLQADHQAKITELFQENPEVWWNLTDE